MRLLKLTLTDFRNHAALAWRPAARIAAIAGPNGGGKTNLLEAVSLLAPGRGLRGAPMAQLPRRDGGGGWAAAARLAAGDGEEEGGIFEIGTGVAAGAETDRRRFLLDGLPARGGREIAARVAAVWLTPQMDRLFTEGSGARRRFLDRLVAALEPGHARELAAHEHALAGRNRLLAGGRADAGWLAALEDGIARHAVALAAARMGVAERLNAALAEGSIAGFPPPRLELRDPVADRLAERSALAVEEALRGELAADRRRDAEAGSARVGAHRADMGLADAATGLEAAEASTGQRKAMLIGVILGHALLAEESRGDAPLLLLDEPAVHLDADRRAALFGALGGLRGQILLTGVDAESFAALKGGALAGEAAIWRMGEGALERA